MTPQTTTETVVISREWNNPQITVTVNRDRITVVTSLESFIEGLILEMKPVKKMQLNKLARLVLGDVVQPEDPTAKEIRRAAQKAIEKIKEATSQVM